jgi:hypothetical protein
MKTNRQLREAIRAALDCCTHFHKPTIVNNDRDFGFGDHPMVICSQCVDRLRVAIGLKEDEPCPQRYRTTDPEWRKEHGWT